MLRITTQTSEQGARTYFATADYYLGDQELPGVWRGKAAGRLGLSGQVQRSDWEALCENRDPRNSLAPNDGSSLTPRTRGQRRVGYDFTFNAPKSLSVLYALTKDGRILDAFRTAVDETMREVEADMKTRVRSGGANEDRTTGNMVWGEFVHLTTRPIDGVPDPHLHAHCFAFNATWDSTEDRWKAGQFAPIKRDGAYFEAVFHSVLAQRVARIGLPVARTRTGWEVEGFQRSTIEKFSRRTARIEQVARENGITDPEAKGALGAKTRERKAKALPFDTLADSWRARLSPDEVQTVLTGQHRLEAGRDEFHDDAAIARQACALAVENALERRSVVPERTVLADALRRGVGRASVTTTRSALASGSLLTAQRDGRTVVTTREVLAEEQALLAFARQGRGTCAPYLDPRKGHAFTDQRLNAGQRRAVLHVLTSKDRVMVVRGAAGVGKTTMMAEAVHAIEASGTKVFTFAPSADASRGVLRREGFENADTVARLLLDEKLQSQVQGHAIWIDEAGLLGTKTLRQVFDLADRLHARIVLSGDTRQHKSVERGDALRLLETQAGLAPAEIKEILRQKDQYKLVVRDLSEGDVTHAFDRLSDLGWIQEQADPEERTRAIARDYVESTAQGVETLVVSPTHAEGDRVTEEIRHQLQARGQLQGERTFLSLQNANLTLAERLDSVNYQPGDVLVFHQNAPGITKGRRVVVGEDPSSLPLHLAQRFQVFRPRAIALAPGDKVRITRGGTTLDGSARLNNGEDHVVRGFTPGSEERGGSGGGGDIVLDDGKVISRDFGHLAHGYVSTSHASQGRSVGKVIVAQSAESFPASSREQFYVSLSRGKRQAVVYTDDKDALLRAVQDSDDRPSATEAMLTPGTAPGIHRTPTAGISPLTPEQRRERVRAIQHRHGEERVAQAMKDHQPAHHPRHEPERPAYDR